MIRNKILIIAPYPIKLPLHGGQKRARAIYEFYKTHFDQAKFVGVFHRGQYPEWDEGDLPLGQADIIKQVDAMPYASELIAGKAIDTDIHVRSHMAELLMRYQPDIIHLEQPFAYLGLKPLLNELGLSPRLIFGSQNIEYPLKERIFKELGVDPSILKKWVTQTKSLEEDFSREADLLVAVNREDAETHRQMGARKIVIAPNGIDKTEATKEGREYWENIKKSGQFEKIVSFVGSGHPPNWEGFLRLVGDDTSFMPDNSKILIVGGVSEYFRQQYADKKKNASFWSGVELIGVIEEGRLSSLLEMSDLIILPITTKRGSNLKTAEAILSGKKIVATKYAFHGFEEFRSLPNIWTADSRSEFKKSISSALESEYVEPNNEDIVLAQQVRWDHRLRPLLPELHKLSRKIKLARARKRLLSIIGRK